MSTVCGGEVETINKQQMGKRRSIWTGLGARSRGVALSAVVAGWAFFPSCRSNGGKRSDGVESRHNVHCDCVHANALARNLVEGFHFLG